MDSPVEVARTAADGESNVRKHVHQPLEGLERLILGTRFRIRPLDILQLGEEKGRECISDVGGEAG